MTRNIEAHNDSLKTTQTKTKAVHAVQLTAFPFPELPWYIFEVICLSVGKSVVHFVNHGSPQSALPTTLIYYGEIVCG